MQKKNNFRIEKADTRDKYAGLRALWCEVFSDEPAFVDSMYSNFGADPGAGIFASDEICGYVMTDISGRIVSALTHFLSGSYDGRPVWTSYAICTATTDRGHGLAGELVEFARDLTLDRGAVSLISPAEPSLEEFYGRHGYEPHFFAERGIASQDDEPFEFDEEDEAYAKFEPEFSVEPLDAAAYNRCREEFLADRPHVELSGSFMRIVYEESMLSDGGSGLCMVNGGDALCALSERGDAGLAVTELLINPKLSEMSSEIAGEIAVGIAAHFGGKAASYSTPGLGFCQAMTAGAPEKSKRTVPVDLPYYGFPID